MDFCHQLASRGRGLMAPLTPVLWDVVLLKHRVPCFPWPSICAGCDASHKVSMTSFICRPLPVPAALGSAPSWCRQGIKVLAHSCAAEPPRLSLSFFFFFLVPPYVYTGVHMHVFAYVWMLMCAKVEAQDGSQGLSLTGLH